MGESLLWCWKTQPAVHWKSMLFKCFLSPSFRPLSCGADVSDQSPPSNPILCLFPQSPFCQAVFDAVHPPHPSSFPSLFTHLLVFSSHTCPYHFKLLPCTLLAIYPFHCSFICHTLCYVASLFWFDYLFSYRSWTLIQTARRYMSTSCDVEGPTTRSRTWWMQPGSTSPKWRKSLATQTSRCETNTLFCEHNERVLCIFLLWMCLHPLQFTLRL